MDLMAQQPRKNVSKRTAVMWAVALTVAIPMPAQSAAPEGARRAEIEKMVRQDCGSCHGMTLRGGLGPSLEARTLAEKDPAQLQFVILNGRRGTPMPPWKAFLSEAEAAWVVEQLQGGRLGSGSERNQYVR